jgi:hypothetical protein
MIVKMDISWRRLIREKSYPALNPGRLIESIRKGQARQGYLRSDLPGFEWEAVKKVTVKNAWPRYYAGNPAHLSDSLPPFAALLTTVETDHGNIDVEIDCPIIDETQQQKVK